MLTKINNVKISAIAAAIPQKVVKIDEYSEIFGEKKVKRIKRSTGVEEVRVVDSGTTASDLCQAAAEELFSKLGEEKETIDAIIFASISPDYKAPATAISLQERLKLKKSIVAFDINFGCSAYIYGLYLASTLINGGGCKRVLLCAGDTQSMMVNPKDRAMKMLVGDAGSATLIESGEDEFCFTLGCDGSGAGSLIIPAGGARTPLSEKTKAEIEDKDGNVRTDEDLYMNGTEVMKFSLTVVPEDVEAVLKATGLAKEEVALFAMHQPNKMILDSLSIALDVPEEKIPIGLTKTGNTAAASIPLLLTVLKERGFDFSLCKNILACGFGIGLSHGCTKIDLSKTTILPTMIYGGE